MATSVAALQVTVGADISKALSGLNKINSAVSSTGGFFGRAASTAAGFGAAMVGLNVLGNVAGAMHDTVGGAIALNSNLETNAIAFETLLGSGQKAQSFLGDLSAFATSTPFTLPDLENDSKRLLAFGFASDQVIPLMRDMGNAASALGTGQEGINRMSLALGQMLAKGKVQGDELLQLTESGVNVGQVFDIMSQQTGKSVAALQKLQAAGKLDPKLFIAAFQTFSQTRFAGLMEKQASSFQGIWENVGETLNFARGAVFAPLFQMLKDLGSAILTFTKTPAFAAWVARLQGWIGTGTTILGAWASTWSNLMKNNGLSFFQAGLTSTEMVIKAVFGPAAAGMFHSFVAFFQTTLPAAWLTVQGAWAALSPKLAELRDWLSVNIPAAWAVLEPKFVALADWLKTTLPAAGDQLSSMWTNLQATLGPFVPTLGTAADALAKLAGAVVSLAAVDLGNTLLALGTFAAIMSAPAFIAGVVSLAALAIAAAPLLLLAGALATIAVVIKQNWPEITTIVGQFFSQIGTAVQQTIQDIKILGGLLVALTMPDVLKQNHLTLPQVLSSAGQGTSLFDLVNQGKKPVFGVDTATSLGITPPPGALPSGALPGPASIGGAPAADTTNIVNFNGPVNASTPEDRQALAQDIAAQWAAAQARTSNAPPPGMPEGP
jgi:tape measure domain-containing protein